MKGVGTGLFANEMRRARENAGLTQEQLAESVAFSISTVTKVEAGHMQPSQQFAEAVDRALQTDGLLSRIRKGLLEQNAVPPWFQPWSEIEEQATELRLFEPLVVPGLLQTERYASAILEGDETRLAARLGRQKILDGPSAVSLVAIVAEQVLRRRVGDNATMVEQLHALAESPARVQVLPVDADTHHGIDGSFALAEVAGRVIAYAETPICGFVMEDDEAVFKLNRHWDVIRGEALPQRQSKQLILEVADEWQSS